MTDFTKKTFSVAVGSDDYRSNFDRIFRGESSEEKPGVRHDVPGQGTECPYLALAHCNHCGWGSTCDAPQQTSPAQESLPFVSPLHDAAVRATEDSPCAHRYVCAYCGEEQSLPF